MAKDALKKIEVETIPVANTEPMSTEAPIKTKQKKKFRWKAILIPLGVILGVVVVLGIMLLPLRGVIVQAQVVASKGKELGAAIKGQDIDKTKTYLGETRKSLDVLAREYGKVKPLSVVPFLGAYVNDGQHAINAAFAGLDAGDRAIEALEPNADLLGLKGKSKFVAGTADERLQTAVKTMTALTPKVNEMAVAIDKLGKELDAIDPNRYPERIGKTVVRSRLVGMKETIENAANLFVNAQPLLINLPKMLGEPKEQRYLVLFQNDKELRATGGFLTAYAQFRFVHGKPILEKADDIYALDAALRKKFPAPREIEKFHKGVYNLNIRDSNLSPDFAVSMKQFEQMYEQTSGKEKIDGIWAVDTHVLVEFLRILGPEEVYGRVFSAETDKRCDCPKAVYELEDYSSRPVGYLRSDRKDIIGVLLQRIMQKALGVSPSQYWGRLFQMLITEINQKHVLAYFHDIDAQKAAESFNMAGRVMTAENTATLFKYKEDAGWDYLHVNNSNMAGAKANMFVKEAITKDVTVNGDGTVTTKLLIKYDNPYAGSDCNLEHGQLCLNAPMPNWLRVYVPKGSKLVDSKGSQDPKTKKGAPMEMYESLGKTVFEGYLVVPVQGQAQVEVTYTSPVQSADKKYRLLIQKQPGTEGQEYVIKLGGKEKKRHLLGTDTEFVL